MILPLRRDEPAPVRELPPIDLRVPSTLESATFAVG
jgi:hypothetical protein